MKVTGKIINYCSVTDKQEYKLVETSLKREEDK